MAELPTVGTLAAFRKHRHFVVFHPRPCGVLEPHSSRIFFFAFKADMETGAVAFVQKTVVDL